MLILGVDKNAQRMVQEIHRQFQSIPGLKEGKHGVKPEYGKCIDIATSGALKELIPAGLMSIIATLLVGFIGGPLAIGGFLLGNIVSGLLIALFMSNSGGLWDNSKKYIESGEEGGKGSEAHKAAVIGDLLSSLFVWFSIFHSCRFRRDIRSNPKIIPIYETGSMPKVYISMMKASAFRRWPSLNSKLSLSPLWPHFKGRLYYSIILKKFLTFFYIYLT